MPGKKKTNQKNFSNIEPGNGAHLLQMMVALTLVHLVCFVYSSIFLTCRTLIYILSKYDLCHDSGLHGQSCYGLLPPHCFNLNLWKTVFCN